MSTVAENITALSKLDPEEHVACAFWTKNNIEEHVGNLGDEQWIVIADRMEKDAIMYDTSVLEDIVEEEAPEGLTT